MKWVFSSSVNGFQTNVSILIMRLGVGALMLTHGWPKFQRLIGSDEITFPDPLGIGPVMSLTMATLTEVVGSILIMAGLATRLAAFSLAFTMAVAAFIVHADDPFKQKELALLYLMVYIVLMITGSGKYSIDKFIGKP